MPEGFKHLYIDLAAAMYLLRIKITKTREEVKSIIEIRIIIGHAYHEFEICFKSFSNHC